ncbi:MAG: ABC transporter ATP-binding protein [Acidimicrobiia bacterium]|nr:ABC transporter ATP-binding protein [Acidimicrobiia bacterium]
MTQTVTETPMPPEERRTQAAVVVEGLVKHYPHPDGGTFAAVDGVDLTVRRGEVFGILGPNGAGKTTTLEMIEGLTRRDGGRISVLGMDPADDPLAVKRRIGVQLQSSAYFEFLRLGEILDLFGGFYPKRLAADDLLARVGLTGKRNALVGELSGGQAQRFSIVAALVNDPDVVFLDEPTTGLDPQARRNVWDVISSLANEGRTVILTTHSMEEAEALSDRIAIIDHGRVVAVDTPLALMERHGVGTRVAFAAAGGLDLDVLGGLAAVDDVRATGNGTTRYVLAVSSPDVVVPALYRWAVERGVDLADVTIRRSTLEDVFLNLTGSRLRD